MAFGRVIASGANGVLSYSLADHLGSTVQQISGGTAGRKYPRLFLHKSLTTVSRSNEGEDRLRVAAVA